MEGLLLQSIALPFMQIVIIDYSKKFDRKSVESEIRVANDLARA
jgi:hypothetical protein